MNKTALFSLLLIALSCSPIFGDSTIIDDFRIDVTAPTHGGSLPTVVCDSVGNYAVIWREDCEDSSRIMARSFLPSGSPANDIRHLETIRPEAVIRVAGSMKGAFVLTWYQSKPGEETRTKLQMRRYSWNLEAIDYTWTVADFEDSSVTYTITSCAAAIDRSGNAFIAYTRKWIGSDLTIVHVDRNRSTTSWHYEGNRYLEYTVPACTFSGPDQVTILFSQGKYRANESYTNRALSRSLRFTGSTITPVDDFHELRQLKSPLGKGDWYLAGAGTNRWNGTIATFNDSIGIRFARLDSTAALSEELLTLALNETTDSWSIGNYNNLQCAAGLSGTYAIVRTRGVGYNNRSIWLHWADSLEQNPIHELKVGIGNTPSVAVDGMGRKLVAWKRNGGVYFRRIGDDSIATHRINAAGVDPKVVAVNYSKPSATRNDLYTAWNYGDNENIGLSRRELQGSPYWPKWAISFPGIPLYGLPRIEQCTRHHIAVAYLHISGSADTALILSVRSKADGSQLVTNRVNDNGTSPGAADIAVNGDKIFTVWRDRRADHGDTSYLYGQFFDTTGGIIGGNIPLLRGDQLSLCITNSGRYGLGFTIATVNYSQIPGGPAIPLTSSDVYLAGLSPDGAIHSSPIKVNTSGINASDPHLCALNGSILIVWKESGTGSSHVYGRSYNGVGPLSAPTRYSGEGFATTPSVTNTHDSCAVVTWFNKTSKSVEYIVVDKHGQIRGEITRVNRDPITATDPSLVVSGDDNRVLFGWIDDGNQRALAELVQIESPGASRFIRRHSRHSTSHKRRLRMSEASVFFDMRGRRLPSRKINLTSPGVVLEVRPDEKVPHKRAIPRRNDRNERNR